MIIIKYNNGRVETVGSSISPIWFASRIEKNGGIKECYEIILDGFFIEKHFEDMKDILEGYKIKQEKI